MSIKIVADSSSDVIEVKDIDYSTVALKINTDEREFIDNPSSDPHEMTMYLKKYKGRSRSACPNVQEWEESFGDSENVICITITSTLSGSYNSACVAANEYMKKNPGRKVYVIDTLSVGPETAIIIEKMREMILNGMSFDQIVEDIEKFRQHTHLAFALESLENLVNNGRIHTAVAKIAGVLGIRICGKANLKGDLEITNKSRGQDKAVRDIYKNMLTNGYNGGSVRIHHCENIKSAELLKEKIVADFPNAEIFIQPTRILCSYYAEIGGFLVGYEGNEKPKN